MIEIRPLRKDDEFKDLVSLSREFFEEYGSHHKGFFALDALRDDDIVSYFSNLLDNDDGEVIVAREEGRIVGYIAVCVRKQPGYWKVKRVGDISGLMVQNAYRRRGIARQLMDKAKEFFEKKGVKYFTVYTAIENRGAIKFYEQSGLQPLYTTMLGKVPE